MPRRGANKFAICRMGRPSRAVSVIGRAWRKAGAGTVSGVCCPSFPGFTTIAPNTRREVEDLCQQLVHIVLGDQARALAELFAQPAHDRRRVREFAVLEDFLHAGIAAGAFPCLADAVAVP